MRRKGSGAGRNLLEKFPKSISYPNFLYERNKGNLDRQIDFGNFSNKFLPAPEPSRRKMLLGWVWGFLFYSITSRSMRSGRRLQPGAKRFCALLLQSFLEIFEIPNFKSRPLRSAPLLFSFGFFCPLPSFGRSLASPSLPSGTMCSPSPSSVGETVVIVVDVPVVACPPWHAVAGDAMC